MIALINLLIYNTEPPETNSIAQNYREVEVIKTLSIDYFVGGQIYFLI